MGSTDSNANHGQFLGPGLKKIEQSRAFRAKTLDLVRVRRGVAARCLASADVISEGEAIEEGGRLVFYGSTSVQWVEEGADRVPPEVFATATLLDPHFRLMLLRMAQREATGRAGAPLNVMHAEVRAKVTRNGDAWTVTASIDVSAEVLAAPAARKVP